MWRNQTKVLDDGGEGGCKGCDVLLVHTGVYASYSTVCMVFQIALLFLFEVSKVLYLKSKCSLGWDLVLVKF